MDTNTEATTPAVAPAVAPAVPAKSWTRESALAAMRARPRTVEQVQTPIGVFLVREPSAQEKDSFEAAQLMKRRDGSYEQNMDNIRAKLVVRVVVDEDGKRIFADDDAVALGGMGIQIIGPLHEAAQRLSKVTDKDIEELAKNSVAGTGTSSV